MIVMNRQPSTTLPIPSSASLCTKPKRAGSPTWKNMFKAAQQALGIDSQELGLVGISGQRAWFQIWADTTPYSIELSPRELDMFFID